MSEENSIGSRLLEIRGTLNYYDFKNVLARDLVFEELKKHGFSEPDEFLVLKEGNMIKADYNQYRSIYFNADDRFLPFIERLEECALESLKAGERKKEKIQDGESTMCWDHCNSCGNSQGRFWVDSQNKFEEQTAKVLGHKCQFCESELETYNEVMVSIDGT